MNGPMSLFLNVHLILKLGFCSYIIQISVYIELNVVANVKSNVVANVKSNVVAK